MTEELSEFLIKLSHEFQKDFIDLLASIEDLFEVEAFAIYATGGFADVGYAVRRKAARNEGGASDPSVSEKLTKMLSGHDDLLEKLAMKGMNPIDYYSQICADEWHEINAICCFLKTNTLIDDELDYLYDSGVEPNLLSDEIFNVILSVLSDWKENELSHSDMDDNIFISIQVSGNVGLTYLKDSTRKLNTKEWINRVENYIREMT